eukprot:gnl/TRDRNA2_/TRDRNA2_54566_c0_seq1.p1 gnl/TRDRNA2_/TRDRNA2_54566_c0~~gnl/TRDRNA2_/TRDRNA2_54566_c0_seq1.p1  ORF type:complete len:265 (+),score=36.95 gnl/TRDRNA2_/TRDRNA2_54566_c0_seq1:77-871(+)
MIGSAICRTAASLLLLTNSVLAGNKSRYGDPKYWEETYNASGKNATHEWFFGADLFVPLVKPHMKQSDRVLQLGCGNSLVAEALAADGFTNVMSVDISPSVIAANQERYPVKDFPSLRFEVADVFAMSNFGSASFDAAIDKGTWDAIPKPRSRDMLKELRRVLRPGGLYLVLTFSRPGNALDYLLDWRIGWQVENFVKMPSPLQSSIGDGVSGVSNFYLYVCRNSDRTDDWRPKDVTEEVATAVQDALDYQGVDKRLSGHAAEL